MDSGMRLTRSPFPRKCPKGLLPPFFTGVAMGTTCVLVYQRRGRHRPCTRTVQREWPVRARHFPAPRNGLDCPDRAVRPLCPDRSLDSLRRADCFPADGSCPATTGWRLRRQVGERYDGAPRVLTEDVLWLGSWVECWNVPGGLSRPTWEVDRRSRR